MRIGHGYDAHRLVPGRPLRLGGVAIEHELGLAGHSDADVALHALCDALLGAAALGDIGLHFPPSDEAYAGADSRVLLREVVSKISAAGWRCGNADITVVAERPRLRPHITRMREVIAHDLQVAVGQVSVKATTTEKMGFAGREEGIACHAVVLLLDAAAPL